MRKVFEFKVKGHKIKIVNSWFAGAKLYVDGDLRDHDSSMFATGKTALLCAKLADLGILEVFPLSGLVSVEMDAFLITSNDRLPVYSSRKDLSVKAWSI